LSSLPAAVIVLEDCAELVDDTDSSVVLELLVSVAVRIVLVIVADADVPRLATDVVVEVLVLCATAMLVVVDVAVTLAVSVAVVPVTVTATVELPVSVTVEEEVGVVVGRTGTPSVSVTVEGPGVLVSMIGMAVVGNAEDVVVEVDRVDVIVLPGGLVDVEMDTVLVVGVVVEVLVKERMLVDVLVIAKPVAVVVVVVPSSQAISNMQTRDVSPTSKSTSPIQVFPVGKVQSMLSPSSKALKLKPQGKPSMPK